MIVLPCGEFTSTRRLTPAELTVPATGIFIVVVAPLGGIELVGPEMVSVPSVAAPLLTTKVIEPPVPPPGLIGSN